ncbi:hypothetical protein GCM10022419_033320 [Nonomuraea rosea]|uniref:PH domain-containing protein n=1 Tax=Nonomuraea rosea TaxID=638574 RepID=A0ABP6WG89_9ACTN
MATGKRTALKWFARIGWGLTVVILVGIFLELDPVVAQQFFFGRLFALSMGASIVLTLGLWFETSRARTIIPTEEVWKAGVQYGVNWRRFDPAAAEQLVHFLQQPVNGQGPQESPPVKQQPR